MFANRRDAILFTLSAVTLAYLAGALAMVHGWFPSGHILEASVRATDLLDPPDFVHERPFDWSGVRSPEPARYGGGLTLIASHWRDSDWRPGLELIDREGRVLHEWQVDVQRIFGDDDGSRPALLRAAARAIAPLEKGVHGAYLFPNGDVLLNVDYLGTARLDACGEVVWALAVSNHHSVARADDGTFWIHARSLRPAGAKEGGTEVPGLEPSPFHDRILRVSESGEVLRDIDVLSVLLSNDMKSVLTRSKWVGTSSTHGDVTHLNDVEPLHASLADEFPMFSPGDLLVSLRNVNLVLVLDPRSLRVKWHAMVPFLQQHDPDFMAGGWIGVFDNRVDYTDDGGFLGGSRIVALRPGSDSVAVLFPGPRLEPFYTERMGKWQRLRDGHLLLTEAQAGRIVEVDPEDGRTVWEWAQEPYRDRWVPEVSEGTRYDLTPGEVGSWPCSPAADDDKGGDREP